MEMIMSQLKGGSHFHIEKQQSLSTMNIFLIMDSHNA